MPLAVNDIIGITYRSSWQEQRILLTLTYKITGTDSTQSVATDLAAISMWFTEGDANKVLQPYLSCLAQDVLVESVRAQKISGVRSVYKETAINTGGLVGFDAVTGNVAFPITLKTDLAGRNQVANKHIGPLPSNFIDSGKLNVAANPNIVNLETELLDSVVVVPGVGETITLFPVIFHKSNQTSDFITSAQHGDRIGTMRRRTLRVGE